MALKHLRRMLAQSVLFALPVSIFVHAQNALNTASPREDGGGDLQATFVEINPDSSSSIDPDAASGGRINSLSRSGRDTVYAASEWGGLFVSRDSGVHWQHIDTHSPTATWRVLADPQDSKRVFATSLYDGKTNSLSVINLSQDGGQTWFHPSLPTPGVGFCSSSDAPSEPAGLGISIDPTDSRKVYVGTNCGLLISSDSGLNWRRVDPTPGDPADTIWDVLVHHNGVLDACGDDGHLRSTNGGETWSINDNIPSGQCSLTVSPDDTNVIFETIGENIYESDDGGKSWTAFKDPVYQGRTPFLRTNKRSKSTFDLWFGDVILYRTTCSYPANPASKVPRCPDSSKWTVLDTRSAGGHDDVGDLLFDAGNKKGPKCPQLFSSDGGIYLNRNTSSPACQTPSWTQPKITPHALWVFSLDTSFDQQNHSPALYFVDQDTGIFYTGDAGSSHPVWTNPVCCDAFDILANKGTILFSSCCYGLSDENTRQNWVFLSPPGLTDSKPLKDYPPGQLTGWKHARSIENLSPGSYVMITDKGVFTTTGIDAQPWNPLDVNEAPAQACGIQVSLPTNSAPVFIVQTANCDGVNPARLFKHVGYGNGTGWSEVNKPFPDGGFGTVSVSPLNPNFIIASYVRGNGTEVHMIATKDGGAQWTTVTQLDQLMTQNGGYEYRVKTGPSDFAPFGGYLQPTLLAIDKDEPRFVIAGGADSGIFFSQDYGKTWQLMTEPVVEGRHGAFSIPRPRSAAFVRDGAKLIIFIGSQGRGVWKMTVTAPIKIP